MAAAPDSAREDKARLDAAFTELYRAHLRDVYSYSYYRVGNHHDAEDLTEQTFLQAYRHFERAQRESQGRPLRPWLIRIAHNLAANYYRDRSRRPQTTIDDAGALPGPDRVAVEILVDELEVVQVEAEMEHGHPDDGDTTQRVEPIEARAGGVHFSSSGGDSNGTPESGPNKPTLE